MFGPKITTVFKSRWNALFWSAGVLLTAYCSIPSQNQDSQADNAASRDTAEAVAKILGQQAPEPDKHVNPWAKKPQG
ncbi:MAG: hypothetical protein P8Y48_10665 [Novosphingobium sp.]